MCQFLNKCWSKLILEAEIVFWTVIGTKLKFLILKSASAYKKEINCGQPYCNMYDKQAYPCACGMFTVVMVL